MKISRRSFLQGSVALGAAASFAAEGNQDVFRTKPYAAAFGPDAVGLSWLTTTMATGFVSWSQDGWRTVTRSWCDTDGLRDVGTVHRALIRGFDPKKAIEWRCHSRPIAELGEEAVDYAGEEVVCQGRLKPLCADRTRVSFAVVNDVHSHVEYYPHLMDCVREPVDFTVFNGDITDATCSEDDIVKGLLGPLGYVTQRMSAPCVYVRGNHEPRGAMARRMREFLLLRGGRYYGAMTWGPARIVFLDTGEDKADDNVEYSGLVDFDGYLKREIAWLQQEVSDEPWRRAPVRILVQHIPFSPKTDLPRLQQLYEVVRNAGVTLAIGGHWHYQQLIEAGKNGCAFPFLQGGGFRMDHRLEPRRPVLTRCDVIGGRIRVRQYAADSGRELLDRTIS